MDLRIYPFTRPSNFDFYPNIKNVYTYLYNICNMYNNIIYNIYLRKTVVDVPVFTSETIEHFSKFLSSYSKYSLPYEYLRIFSVFGESRRRGRVY